MDCPTWHLSGDTKDIVRQGTALIATLASLVLGLLIASANGKYESESSQIKQLTANIVLLDNTFNLYGPDGAPLRCGARLAFWLIASGSKIAQASANRGPSSQSSSAKPSSIETMGKISTRRE
jgi:hypothetical protein